MDTSPHESVVTSWKCAERLRPIRKKPSYASCYFLRCNQRFASAGASMSSEDRTPQFGWCRCCSQRVSSQAPNCPHCGQPAPYQPSSVFRIGQTYTAHVTEIREWGVLVEFANGHESAIHVSELPQDQSTKSAPFGLAVGSSLKVKLIEIDEQGRKKLSARGV